MSACQGPLVASVPSYIWLNSLPYMTLPVETIQFQQSYTVHWLCQLLVRKGLGSVVPHNLLENLQNHILFKPLSEDLVKSRRGRGSPHPQRRPGSPNPFEVSIPHDLNKCRNLLASSWLRQQGFVPSAYPACLSFDGLAKDAATYVTNGVTITEASSRLARRT